MASRVSRPRLGASCPPSSVTRVYASLTCMRSSRSGARQTRVPSRHPGVSSGNRARCSLRSRLDSAAATSASRTASVWYSRWQESTRLAPATRARCSLRSRALSLSITAFADSAAARSASYFSTCSGVAFSPFCSPFGSLGTLIGSAKVLAGKASMTECLLRRSSPSGSKWGSSALPAHCTSRRRSDGIIPAPAPWLPNMGVWYATAASTPPRPRIQPSASRARSSGLGKSWPMLSLDRMSAGPPSAQVAVTSSFFSPLPQRARSGATANLEVVVPPEIHWPSVRR